MKATLLDALAGTYLLMPAPATGGSTGVTLRPKAVVVLTGAGT
jgi:hypothetical protein